MFLFLTVIKLCFPSAKRQYFIKRSRWSALHEVGMTVHAVSPIKVEWSSSVMQRAAACQIQLIDLSAGSHQGDNALAVPVSSSVVQSRPARYNRGQLWSQGTPNAAFSSSAPAIPTRIAHRPKWSFTSRSAAQLNSKFKQSMFLSAEQEVISSVSSVAQTR